MYKVPGFFNLTMTYRQDSSVATVYGQFVQQRAPPEGEKLEEYIKEFGRKNQQLAKKQGSQGLTTAIFLSNCVSAVGRENLVDMIDNFTPVDIYGNCGDLDCPPWEKERCLNLLGDEYKFYLSFENALCKDYVSEKFFKVLNQNIIPVVFNGANMSTVAPPHSYINVADFPTIEKLLAYLSRWETWSHLVKSLFSKGLPPTTPFLRATSGGGVSTKLSTTMRPCRPNTGLFFAMQCYFSNFCTQVRIM